MEIQKYNKIKIFIGTFPLVIERGIFEFFLEFSNQSFKQSACFNFFLNGMVVSGQTKFKNRYS